MKRAAIFSGLLHLVILIIMIIGITDPFSRKLEDQRPLMIEFVDISDITKAPVIAPMDVMDPEPVMEAPQQHPEPQQTPPPPVEQAPAPLPMPEPAPLPPPPPPPLVQPQPAPAPEPLKLPEPEPLPLPEPKKEEPKKPEPKQEEKKPEPKKEEAKKPEPPKKEKAEVNLRKDKPKPKANEAKEKKKIDTEFDNLFSEVVKETKKKDSTKSSGRTKGAPAEQVGEVVTASEIDAIRRAVERCWIVPNGVRGVRDLQVELELNIAKDGTVERARTLDRGRMAADPIFRAAAESGERAAMDPNCNPLPLNPAKYKQWKTTIMTFKPGNMQ